MSERKLKKREVMQALNVTEYTLEKFIAKGILEKPVKLDPRSHPFWTESQIVRAQLNLNRLSYGTGQSEVRIRPCSEKKKQRMLANGARIRLK